MNNVLGFLKGVLLTGLDLSFDVLLKWVSIAAISFIISVPVFLLGNLALGLHGVYGLTLLDVFVVVFAYRLTVKK